jgi:hypothetical protein
MRGIDRDYLADHEPIPLASSHRDVTTPRLRAAWTARSDDLRYLAQLEPAFEDLRKAGVPER